MIKERCWFSQINFFIEYFPHRINIVSFQPILCHPHAVGEGTCSATLAHYNQQLFCNCTCHSCETPTVQFHPVVQKLLNCELVESYTAPVATLSAMTMTALSAQWKCPQQMKGNTCTHMTCQPLDLSWVVRPHLSSPIHLTRGLALRFLRMKQRHVVALQQSSAKLHRITRKFPRVRVQTLGV